MLNIQYNIIANNMITEGQLMIINHRKKKYTTFTYNFIFIIIFS